MRWWSRRRSVLPAALVTAWGMAAVMPVAGPAVASDHVGSSAGPDPPPPPATDVDLDGNTLIVTAGSPGSLTLTSSPGGPGRGRAVACGWFDLVVGSHPVIDVVAAIRPVVGDTYLLWCGYADGRDPTLAGYPIPSVYDPGTIDGPVVSTGEAARHALDSIEFVTPSVELSPAALQVVGIPTWLAVTSALEYQQASAQAGPVWATVRPEFRDATWDLGNGDTVVCADDAAATWDPFAGDDQASNCTYVYEAEPADDAAGFAGSVTVTWDVQQLTDKSGGAWEPWGPVSLTTPVVVDVTQLQAVLR